MGAHQMITPEWIDINAAAREMLAVVNSIIDLTEEENQLFAEGYPAPPQLMVQAKTKHADQFAQWCQNLSGDDLMRPEVSPDLRGALFARIATMRIILAENAERLDIARAASRRRVDAIMQVVRERAQPKAVAYGTNGALAPNNPYSAKPISISMEL